MSFDLYMGDCLEIMPTLPDASVDAVITDPPYCSGGVSEASRTRAQGQGLRSETIGRFGWFTGDNMGTAGLVWLLRSIAIESARICKDSGSMLMFCDWRMLASLQPAIESAGLRFQNLLVWNKTHMGLGNGFRHQHEMIMHFTFGSPAYYHKGTSNVLDHKRIGAGERVHQTQKPVELIERMIEVVCPPGGTVVDPFAGSGTTGVACINTGRNFIGIEKDASYYEIARNRLEVESGIYRQSELV